MSVTDRPSHVKHALETGRRRVDSGKSRFDRSLAGQIWNRLSEIGFIDRAVLLAGVMTLWLIPALLVLDSIRGTSIVTRISEGMTEWRCDGRVGYGLSEYLDQIVDGRPVGAAA